MRALKNELGSLTSLQPITCDAAVIEADASTIEPSAMFGAVRIMAHEEDVVITAGDAELLTPRASRELPP